MAAPRVGTTFAGYRVERVLGRGGMSVVYLAEHPRLKNMVALKLLAPALADDDAFRERLIRESRLAASLNHPNVVPVYDTGEEEGTLFISMRYVDGPDLRTLLEAGPLPLDQVVRVITQVGAALDAAHARGLVHRDVKPANILIEPATGEPPGHAFVSDFGLTKHIDARSGATASGRFVGTIDYMSPEQIQGRQLDGRTDVYALGCVLFACLTGRPPFRGENEVAVIWSHVRDAPPWPTEIDRKLPRAFDAVVERALAKAPEDRYASAGELANDVAAAAATRRRRSPARRRVRRSRVRARSRSLTPALLGLVVGAAAGAAITGALVSRPTQTVQAATRPTDPLDQRLVLRFVPQPLRATCTHAEPPTPDFDVAVVCHPARGVESVEYSHALSGSRMRQRWIGDAWANGVATPGRPVAASGRCGTSPTAARDWTEAPTGARSQIVKHATGRKYGRLLCYESATGWYALEWTDARLDMLAIAYGSDAAAVYRWWSTKGGLEPRA